MIRIDCVLAFGGNKLINLPNGEGRTSLLGGDTLIHRGRADRPGQTSARCEAVAG